MALHFDLTDLRLMLRVAESGSLTRAAEAVHLSLPAASTRIKHLEEGAGAKLLLRTPQGVTLTPPGEALVHHARVVLAQIEHLRDDLQEYAEGIKGHLRVYANTTALGEYLPPVLHRYLQRHPDVSVDLRERLSHDIVRAVQEGQTDIGIVAGSVRTDALQVLPYRSDRLVLVTPRGHALAGRSAVGIDDILGCDVISLGEGSAISIALERLADEAGRILRMRMRVGGFDSIAALVAQGLGIGVMPQAVARSVAGGARFARVPIEGDWARRQFVLCHRPLGALSRAAQSLIGVLADIRIRQPRTQRR